MVQLLFRMFLDAAELKKQLFFIAEIKKKQFLFKYFTTKALNAYFGYHSSYNTSDHAEKLNTALRCSMIIRHPSPGVL